jgi:dTMP kinase
MTHFFIVLEGLDGSGKTEISRRLAALLSDSLGADHVLLTYEPHNPSAAGEYIRDVLGKRITVSSRTLALAFAVNRADHNERELTPFIDRDDHQVIVCDRYVMSSLVYQSTGGLSVDDVMDLNQSARRPNLTLFLDVTPETAARRIGQRQDHRELFEDRFAETRAKYQQVITYLRGRGQQIEVVDANGTQIEVLNGVIETLNRCAPDWLSLRQVES